MRAATGERDQHAACIRSHDGHRQGSSAVHSGVANLLHASVCARASSSALSVSGARPPWRLRKVSIMHSITALRGSPVWLRRGSTRFCALVVPLSDSFSRPTRNTSSIRIASMS